MLLRLANILALIQLVLSAKILGYFPTTSVSHQVTFQPIWRELSLRGHQVTVISPNILNDPSLVNLTEIDVGFAYELMKEDRYNFAKVMTSHQPVLLQINNAAKVCEQLTRVQLESNEVKKLTNSDEEFDVVLVEALLPNSYIINTRYKAPLIGISSLNGLLNNHDAVGNPTHPIISPDFFLNLNKDLNFWERARSFFHNIFYRLAYDLVFVPRSDVLARELYGNDVPSVREIEKNMSMLILNNNPVLNFPRPYVPNVINIDQMHIKKLKPLPKDIKDYLDKSTKGVVYLSLGSNVKSIFLTNNVRTVIVNALAELPYDILWKWENETLPGKPKNVLTRKWFPQQDLLAHPNVKAFITQGGLQSLEETVFYGVPIVCMPFFADQFYNCDKMAKHKKIGIQIDYMKMTKDELKEVIVSVIENKKYKEKIVQLQTIMKDQPTTGLERAIWGIEYVIRYKGAEHLKCSSSILPLYQYFMLDVITVTVLGVILFIYICFKLFSVLFKFSRSKKNKTE